MTDIERADQFARDTATAALARIDKHEAVCTERWNESRGDIAAIRRGIEGLYRRIWQGVSAIIGLLVSLSGYLIIHSLLMR